MTSDSNKWLPAETLERLNAVRKGIRTYVGIDAAIWTGLWVVSLFWIAAALDYLPIRAGSTEMPWQARGVLLAILVLGGVILLVRFGITRLVRPIGNSTAALLLERKYPQLGGRLVTAVELTGKEIGPDVPQELHRTMLGLVNAEANALVKDLPIAPLFRFPPLVGRGSLLGVLLIATAAVGISNPSWFGLWCSRLFALSETKWPRQASLAVDGLELTLPNFTGQTSQRKQLLTFSDNQIFVPRGSTNVLRISADKNAKLVPEVCTASYRLDDGQRGRTNLRRVGGAPENVQWFLLDGPPLEGMSESLDMDIYGADVRLRGYRVEVVQPAVFDRVTLECSYPEYLFDAQTGRWKSESLDYRSGMLLPEGTRVVLKGAGSSELSAIDYVIRTSDTPLDAPPEVLRLKVSGSEFSLPLPTLSGNVVIECLAFDKRGLPSDQIQRYVITSSPDAVPNVQTKLAGIGTAITPNAILPIRGKITDDHAVEQSYVELVAVEEGRYRADLTPGSDGEVTATIDLQVLADAGTLTLKPDTSVSVVVSAKDKYNLQPTEHVGQSDAIQLAIVTPEQLIILLERRELALRGRLEQVISEVTELRSLLEKIEQGVWGTSTAKNVEDESVAYQVQDENSAKAAEQNAQAELARQLRRQLLNMQQSSLQGEKSRDEVAGIESEVRLIHDELINNRVDSQDRRERLEVRVRQPLATLLADSFPALVTQLQQLPQKAGDATEGPVLARTALASTDQVLQSLQEVLQNMLDIESYNEIVDMVRTMLERQEKILERTKSEQKRRVLDQFR